MSNWLKANPFSAIECDCVTTVKLKILDGKCKMPMEEKVIMGALYEEIKQLPSQLFTDVHQFIESLGDDITE